MSVRKSQILFLDDDVTQRLTIVTALRSQATEVHAFGDSAEALRVCSRSAFDLFLVDLGLPGPEGGYDPMAGLTFISSVRKNVSVTRPVVVLTASRQPEILEPAFRAGADDFVLKDEGIAKIRNRVRFWLEGGSFTAEELERKRSKILFALVPPSNTTKQSNDEDFFV